MTSGNLSCVDGSYLFFKGILDLAILAPLPILEIVVRQRKLSFMAEQNKKIIQSVFD